MADKATQIALIKELRDDYDHGFLDVSGVKHFTEPFGFEGSTYLARANPEEIKGLTLANGATEMEGQDANVIAEEIAGRVCGFKPWQEGRGSRLRSACAAVLQHLEEVK